MNDVASALTQSVSKDGQTAMTGPLNMGSNPINSVTTLTGQKLALTSAVAGPVLSVAAPSSGTAMTLVGAAATQQAVIWDGPVGVYHTYKSNGSQVGLIGDRNGVTGGTTGSLAIRSDGSLVWSSGGATERLIASTTGNFTSNAPTAGVAWTINGFSTQNILNLVTAASGVNGVSLTDGTMTAVIQTGQAAGPFIGTTSNHPTTIGSNNANRIVVAANGTVTVNQSTGTATLISSGGSYTPTNPIGNSGTAFTVDCSKSNVHTVTMNGIVPANGMTISNLQDGQSVTLKLTQAAAGPWTLGNATGVKWANNVVGVLSTAAGSIDIITFYNIGGTTFAAIQKAFA
jgi:hypothetical protein